MQLPKYYEDMTVYRDKTAGARSYFLPYPSLESAISGDSRKSDRILTLDGEFSFAFYTSLARVPKAITDPSADISQLGKITVPSSWTEAGYDTDDTYGGCPFPCDPPYIPADSPVGVYVKDFEIPDAMQPLRKYIVFESASSAVYLFINGKLIGYSEVSSALAEFDITDELKDGVNRLAAVVLKYCDGSYLESGREKAFGLCGSVYIAARPKGHFRDAMISTAFSDDCTTGEIDVTVDAVSYLGMEITLVSPDGEISQTVFPDSDGKAKITVENPAFYSAENPVLYTVIVSSAGEYVPFKTGIRETVWSGGLLYNKKRITLKPVYYGRLLNENGGIMTKKDYMRDLAILRRHSVDTVITRDHPMPVSFYQLCDEYGFYVIDTAELNPKYLNRHFPDMISSNNEWEAAVYNRANLLTSRDKNFSCVLAWGFSNDVRPGKNIGFTAERIKRLDKMRAVHYGIPESGRFPENLIDFSSVPVFNGKFDSRETAQRIKQKYCPVKINALSVRDGRFEIENRYCFSYISRMEIFYEISRYGRVEKTESLGIMTLAPGKTAEIGIDYGELKDGVNHLRFIYKNIWENEMLPDGCVIGFDRFIIGGMPKFFDKQLPDDELFLETRDDSFTVKNRSFSFTFDRTAGYIRNLCKNGKTVAEKIIPSVFLAEDAARGNAFESFANERIVCRDSEAEKKGGRVIINCECAVGVNGEPNHIAAAFSYEVNRAGEIFIRYRLKTDNELPGISRVGFDAYMPVGHSALEYYSLGPVTPRGEYGEGYFGRFSQTVSFGGTSHYHEQASFAAVYDSARSGVIFYQKDGAFSFFANKASQRELFLGTEGEEHTVLSCNPSFGCEPLEQKELSGNIYLKAIDSSDGSLWSVAAAKY